MWAVDTSFLIFYFDGSKHKPDSKNYELYLRAKSLMLFAKEQRQKILIPSVSLAEYLVKVKTPEIIVDAIQKDKRFFIANFDIKSAIEHAILSNHGKYKDFSKIVGRQGIKFDCQIIAIAASNKSLKIYSGDEDLLKVASDCDLEVIELKDIALHSDFLQKVLI